MSNSRKDPHSRGDIVRFLVLVLVGIGSVLAAYNGPSLPFQLQGTTIDLRFFLILAVIVAVAYFMVLYVKIQAERGGLSIIGSGRVDMKIQTTDGNSVRRAFYELSRQLASHAETLKQGETYTLGTVVEDAFPHEILLVLHFYAPNDESRQSVKSAYCKVSFDDWSLSLRCGRGHKVAFNRLEAAVKAKFAIDLITLGDILVEKRP